MFCKTGASKFESLLKSALTVAASLVLAAGCVKPGTHAMSDDSATFFNDKVEGTSETSALVEGYSIPKEKLFTFKTCLKDRRTEEALAGHSFTVNGGRASQSLKADESGCIKWSEKIAFNFLAQEKYLPITRAIVGSGMATGTRTLKLAINPWNLNDKATEFADLAYTQVPAEMTANESDVADALGGASVERKLYVENLPVENTPGEEAGKLVRNFKLQVSPSILLTDVTGAPVKLALTSAKMDVSATLIESKTTGGQSARKTISSSRPIRAVLDGSRYRAVIPLEIQGGDASVEYQLAIRVTPVDAPLGLQAFEGLYDLGDLAAITHSGGLTGELKASNADGKFVYDSVERTTAVSGSSASPGSSPTGPNGTMLPSSNQNQISVTRAGTFEFTMPEPSYSGFSSDEAANFRIVKYSVKSCVKDLSNGGRPAIGVWFEITKKNGQKIKKKTLEVDSTTAQKGCLIWEEEIEHYYYSPEHWTVVPVAISHESGAKTTAMAYAVAPYERWNFTTDVMAKPQFIKDVNDRDKSTIRSRILADGIEFNTMGFYKYEVDDFLAMQIVKTVAIRVPVRAYRPSNMLAGLNHMPEPLRTGRYLLKSAFVAPVRGFDGVTRMLVLPMRGLNRIVDVLGGELKADLDFAIPNLTILNARTYFVFELYVLDEKKLPKNDPYLERTPGLDPASLIDRSSQVVTPTFISPMWLKGEKDGSIVLAADKMTEGPSTDQIDRIVKRNSSPDVIKAVDPVAKKKVDELYAIARADREAYRKRMIEERKMGLFAQRANAEYVALFSEKAMLASDPRLAANNIVLRKTNALGDLLAQVNVLARPAVTQNDLHQFIHKEVPLPQNLAQGLCGYFMGRLPRAKLSPEQMQRVEGGKGAWIELCLRMLKSEGWEKVFAVDRRARAFEVQSQTTSGFGRDLDIQAGTTVGFSHSKSLGWGFNAGWGSGGITGELSKLGMTLGKGAAASPFMKFITSVPGYLGVGVDVSRGFRQSNDVSKGFQVASGKVIHMEQKELRITMKKYEDCAIVRVRPDFLAKTSSLQVGWMDNLLGGGGRGEMLALRGLLICGGFVNTQPLSFTERYYTFGSPTGEQNMLDQRDPSNLPWLLSMRGQRDYAYFLMLLSGDRDIRKLDVLKIGRSAIENERIDLGDMPLAELTSAYDRFLQGKMSTVPGYLTREGTIIKRP